MKMSEQKSREVGSNAKKQQSDSLSTLHENINEA